MRDVRRDGIEQQHHRFERFVAHRPALATLVVELANRIQQFHQRCDRGVEGVAAADVVGDLLDRLVDLATQRLLRRIELRGIDDRMIGIRRMRHDFAPEPAQEARHAFDAGLVPFQ